MLWWTLRQLKSNDPETRARAALKLGEVKAPRVVALLVAALKDIDFRVRQQATVALAEIGDARAVKPLIAALKDSDCNVRNKAVEALVKIGDALAVEPLIAALKDSARDVRYKAAEALGKIGDVRAVEPLIAAIKDGSSDVRMTAVKALSSLKWQPADEAQRATFAVASYDWDEAVRLGAAAVESLVSALTDSNSYEQRYTRRGAAEALGEIGDARAVEPLIAALKDSNEEVRCSAVRALGKIGDARAISMLVVTSKEDSDDNVRFNSKTALFKIGYEHAVEPLITALKDSDGLVRWRAAEALGEIGDARAVEPLIAALKDSSVQRVTAEALGRIGDARAVEPLIAMLNDNDHDLRKAAVKALRLLSWQPADEAHQAIFAVTFHNWDEAVRLGEAAVEPLVAALKDRDRDSDVRRAVAEALRSLKWQPVDEVQRAIFAVTFHNWDEAVQLGATAIEPLVIALKDSNSGVRRGAAESLGKIGGARAVYPLITALKDEKGMVQLIAIRALVKIGTAAVEELISALNYKSGRMRRGAAKALGMIGDTRAVERRLIAALKDNHIDVRRNAADALERLGWRPENSAEEVSISSVSEPLMSESKMIEVQGLMLSDSEVVEKLGQLCSAYSSDDKERIRILEPVATKIGAELDDRGGLTEMKRIFNVIPSQRGKRTLEMHWDGIGEWRG